MKNFYLLIEFLVRASSSLYSKPIMRFTADSIRNDLGVEVYNDSTEDIKATVSRFENDTNQIIILQVKISSRVKY